MDRARNRTPNDLKRYRRLNGYTQKDVATILGHKSSNRISKWEKGSSKPGFENLFDLGILYSTLAPQLYHDLYQARRKKILEAKNQFEKRKHNLPQYEDDS